MESNTLLFHSKLTEDELAEEKKAQEAYYD
jgi:hypothetical protein